MVTARMRAVWCRSYGGPEVLETRQVAAPVVPTGGVHVRVRAAAVTSGDARIRAARFPRGMGWPARLALGLTGPRRRILGSAFAGDLLDAAAGFAKGQPVFGMTGMRLGAHAEEVCAKADGAIAAMPEGLGFDAAAALSFGGTTALHFLRDKARVQAGERVMIVGAAGQVGVAAVQVARLLGAEVTAVCRAAHVDLVRRLGATHVVDHTCQDVLAEANGQDVLMDCADALNMPAAVAQLAPNGRFIALAAGLPGEIRALRGRDRSGRRVIAGVAAERRTDLEQLAAWAVAGQFDPVITARFPLEGAREAHALIDTGHKVGSVILELA